MGGREKERKTEEGLSPQQQLEYFARISSALLGPFILHVRTAVAVERLGFRTEQYKFLLPVSLIYYAPNLLLSSHLLWIPRKRE